MRDKYVWVGYMSMLLVGLGVGFYFGSQYMEKSMSAFMHMGHMGDMYLLDK